MTTTAFNRRGVLRTGLAMGAAAAAGFPALHALAQGKQFSGQTLRLLTWSDVTGQEVLTHIAKTFEEKTGAKVVADRTGGTSDMVAKLKAAGNRPQYDVLTLAGVGQNTLAQAGLLAQPDLNQLPNLKDVDPRFRTSPDGTGIGYLLWTGGMIYNTRTVKTAPTSYEELWSPKYAKRLFLPPANWADALDTIVAAAKTVGGSMAEPEGGLKKLAQLRDRVLTFGENPTQIAELIRTGQLDIGAVYPPALLAKEMRDPNSGIGSTYALKEGFFADLMYTVVPKAHPAKLELAMAFINHTLDPVVQGKMAEAVLNGPVNQKAVLSDYAKKSPHIIKPEQLGPNAIVHDRALLAKVREDWIKRYTQLLT
ncbi:extracellular solute-binding protein [Ottowia testudinis]|uniref:Extracellular solute-binding protein n=1 Tax=Ottowia testudinis TaxID=2816950 RepID=A0A975CIN2_9BURK|nr:extracellular solute-binding protein [Ottowia testudinis]QTD46506.1 extracellular solute-binding protein [Ottowia testudinis]